jgi:cellulose synthase/poly-beta-1,6-N-acetylglucosamine synthase-like glycosyltransferase
MNTLEIMLGVGSLLLAAQAAYSTGLMLYAWENREQQRRNGMPEHLAAAEHSFTVLLPARHEEEVIQQTIEQVVNLNYPRELVQVLVVIEAGDHGTIAKVNEKLDELAARGITSVRLITFDERPINKPHGLNIGLAAATGEVVTIFDAEDEPHPDILAAVNTIMVNEGARVVQCGVQLMNYDDHWFSALNVLEYFFWFKSRMHYHARVGMVPLGGNTVFITRELLERMGGWDQHCLTEDAEIGIRLSVAGVPIRVVYDDAYVTREETPPSAGQFIKQRTRWNQGFLQVLAKGDWRRLPTLPQRLLALYTLAFPLIQAITAIYVPLSLWLMIGTKVPVLIAMISTLPLYMLFVQFAVSLAGLYEFTAVHRLRTSPLAALRLLIAYLPFQLMLGLAALRAVWRLAIKANGWEKTRHVGAHRSAIATSALPAGVRPIEERIHG